MTKRGTLLGWLLLGAVGVLSAEGCGSRSRQESPKTTRAAGTGGKGNDPMTVEPHAGQGGEGPLPPYDPSCGVPATTFCVPDEPNNALCKPAIGGGPSQLPGAGRGSGGEVSAGGQSGDSAAGAAAMSGESNGGAFGGQAGEPAAPLGGAPGSTDQGGAGAGGETELGPTSGTGGRATAASGGQTLATSGSGGVPVSTLSPTSCQVTRNPKHPDRPLAQCLPAGDGDDAKACLSGSDCQPGFACVGEGPGQCRRYCCSGQSSCGEHQHCTVEPLVLASAGETFEVPVCMPVIDCSLAEPFPCDEGKCSCPPDSACVVIGNQGTTSCVPTASLPPRGEGEDGMPCPCARGFVCSQAAKQCVKLCQVEARDLYCGGARCQASSSLPAGWGTCVGVPPKGGAK
jgi:hypothetical protein